MDYELNTDALGKQKASQLIRLKLGAVFCPTENKYNKLDGRFIWDGNVFGLESKYADYYDRFYEYTTIPIAVSKYEYATGKGMEISGLTTTYMMYFTVTPDNSTDLYICDFRWCQKSPVKMLWVPNSHKPNSGYHKEPFYIVPMEYARHYKIINGQLYEVIDGQLINQN